MVRSGLILFFRNIDHGAEIFLLVQTSISCCTHINSIYLYVFRAAVPVAQAMVRRPDRGIPQITGEGMETSFPARRLLSALQRKTGMGRTALFLCAVIARWIFRRAFFVGKMPGSSRIVVNAAKGMGSYERTNDLAVRTDRPFRRRLYGGTARVSCQREHRAR